MEAAPPSYDYATSKNHWSLIAPYIRSEDLISACLVCKTWHRSFAPQLWGNPSSHFMHLLDDPWLGLRKFERIIQSVARFELRQLTHTLQIPFDTESLYEEIYSSKWLFNILHRLPRLQCLLVPNVSSFDHEALSTLRRSALPDYEQSNSSSGDSLLSTSHMRLLDASNCRNVTSTALLTAFEMFPNLMYLELSGVPAASFAEIPPNLKYLRDLKVLNLRRVRLTDAMLSTLASGIARRVRSLDIRENPTTEKSLAVLLATCFGSREDHAGSSQDRETYRREDSDAPPSYERRPSPISVQGQDFGHSLYKALNQGPVNRLAFEDASDIGITHLRMSMKSISAKSLFTSFRCQYLQHLDIDCGNVNFNPQMNMLNQTPRSLEFLRIHHSLITGHGPPDEPPVQAEDTTSNSLQNIMEERRIRAQDGRTHLQIITASLPSLRTFVLTGVPVQTTNSSLASRLIQLIRNCAINSTLAKTQARLENSSTDRTRSDNMAVERRAKALFPLEKIVLELAATKADPRKQLSKGWNYREDTKAVTGDKDSEALWAAAATDFSFFDNEEHGAEPDVRLETLKLASRKPDEAGSHPQGVSSVPSGAGQRASAGEMVDVVGEIVAYRKAARKQHEDALSFGEVVGSTDYHWDGIVSLVRN